MLLSSAFVALFLTGLTYASIGPASDLYVANKVISPDGFSRS